MLNDLHPQRTRSLFRIGNCAAIQKSTRSRFGFARLATCVFLATVLVTGLSACMALAKRWPHDTASADAVDEPAMVVGYMRNYLVHSTYGEITRVDGESLGSATYAATLAPGRRLIVVRMAQVSAMNPLIFGGSSCTFELNAVASTTYQLKPPEMKAYWSFWSHPLGAAPKRFETTLHFNASVDGAKAQSMEITADCGNPEACRASSDCEFLRGGDKSHDPEGVVCERQPADRFGQCAVASIAAEDATAE